MYVSIIGSREFTNCDKLRYEEVVHFAINELNKVNVLESSSEPIILVSGGAAYGDHLAISIWKLYNTDRSLFTCTISDIILHLPCPITQNGYYDNGGKNLVTNPGSLSNFYHNKFSNMLGVNTLLEIYELKDKCKVYQGFHVRNNAISKCDVMFAFTDISIMSKGTSYTWNKCKSSKKYQFVVNE